jgi:hypothetical protein
MPSMPDDADGLWCYCVSRYMYLDVSRLDIMVSEVMLWSLDELLVEGYLLGLER